MDPEPESESGLPEPPRPAPRAAAWRRLRPGLAWLVIAVVAGTALVMRQLPAPDEGADDPLTALVFRAQARYMVGAAQLFGAGDRIWTQARALDTGGVSQRLRFAALAAELSGPEAAGAALLELDELLAAEERRDDAIRPTPRQQRLRDLLGRVYLDESDTPLGREAHLARLAALEPGERATLEAELGWLAGAVLAPAGTPDTARREAFVGAARRTTLALLAAGAALAAAGLAGMAGLIVLLVRLATGRLAPRFAPGSAPHAVYAETFAVWMLLFIALQLAAAVVVAVAPAMALVALFVGFLLSLSALSWPAVRGVEWPVVRRDVGLHAGPAPWLEPLVGAAGYFLTLPLLGVGLVVSLLFLMLENALTQGGSPLRDAAAPAHPIAEQLARGDPWTVVQVFALASFAAPLVEETMFRGVLYRHLRDASSRFGRAGSVLAAGTLDAFLFAAIHPQGWVAIPALMALAWSFVLLREWRDSLLPSMVVHGISNGVVLAALLLLTRS